MVLKTIGIFPLFACLLLVQLTLETSMDLEGKCSDSGIGEEGSSNDFLLDFSQSASHGAKALLTSLLNVANGQRSSKECIDFEFRKIDSKLAQIKTRIHQLESKLYLLHAISEIRKIFDKVHFVYASFKIFRKLDEPASRSDAEHECREHNPRNSLIEMARRGGDEEQSNLYKLLVKGAQFDEQKFEEYADMIVSETGLCAVLAMECEKLRHPNASVEFKTHKADQIREHLGIIKAEIESAREHLLTDYVDEVGYNIEEALKFISLTRIPRIRATQYIKGMLTRKYFFRSWAVMVYEFIDRQQTSEHVHEGTTANWFFVQDEHLTVVAHAADKKLNCSFFGGKLRGRTLRQLFANDALYHRLLEHSGELGYSLQTLRRLLIMHGLPQDHFISIVAYKPSLTIRRDGDDHHFFEHLKRHDTNRAAKSVLIGWC